MRIDASQFHAIVQRALAPDAPGLVLTQGEARAIVQVLYLALEADLDEDSDEMTLFRALNTQVSELAGVSALTDPPLRRVPMDDEERGARVRELAGQLGSRASRELAYMLAYLVIVTDLALAPIESTFLGELRRAFGISESRAGDLATEASATVTPPGT